MKKVVVFFMVLMLVFSFSAYAKKVKKVVEVEVEDSEVMELNADNVISANVLAYLGGFFNVAYERKIVDMLSIRARAFNWAIFSVSDGQASFWGVGGDLYFYPGQKACREWFLGPRFDSIWLSIKDNAGNEGSLNLMMLGAQAGYKFVFEGGFEMGVALGAITNIANSYTATVGNESGGDTLPTVPGFLPTVDFDIGFAF